MDLLELAFKALLLAGPPLGTLIGLRKAKTFWPLAFLTFIGATITVINLRIAAQLSSLQGLRSPTDPNLTTHSYHAAAWILGIVILVLGLSKIHRRRKSQALAELLKDDE